MSIYHPAEFKGKDNTIGRVDCSSEINGISTENRRFIETISTFLRVHGDWTIELIEIRIRVTKAETNKCAAGLKTSEETIRSMTARSIVIQTFAIDQSLEFDFELTRTGA